MCDMGVLDNLVANTAYLKAQGGDDRELKKRRRSLSLPKPEECMITRATLEKDFQLLCERQPIGKKLFRQFLLESNPQYVAAAEFLDELVDWDLAEVAGKDKARMNIINKFCKAHSKSFLSYLVGEVADKCKAVTDKDFEDVMNGKVKDATQEYLKGKPFSEYQNSHHFDKFLQWKEFEKQKITEKYFYEFRTLGKGGFGEVCAVQVKNTGQMYACKKLCKKRLKEKDGDSMALLEKQILEKVNSRFLKGLEMNRVVYYAAQVTTGILHLHAMDIAYRDMKPENVLLDSFGQCRLSDLGLAVELPGEKAGTSGYMAPEILKKEPYRMSVDWWALGCSIYEMVAARLPFKDYKEKVQKEEVARRTLEDECKYDPKYFDEGTKTIIALFLKKKISARLGCRTKNEDPRKHEWFKCINFPRLEAGLIEPPWVPKPNVVYAKDTGDMRDFSEIKGVVFDQKDEMFFKEFSTGAVPTAWQQEMIDSGLFDELSDPNRKESAPGLNDKEKESKSCTLL
uniref:G protein-coupled receptor kinase n=1 Tax=Esox lucius TaxID=8010 RepID=A0AAY5KYM3_ESOLU